MNWRSRISGIATGDQAIFVDRNAFESVGGFPDQPLMEDVELSKRLRALSPPACLRARVITSGRRWESRGVWRTIFLMWRLRWAYWRGVPASVLAGRYE
jgi:GT2 family glycosyltransferase